MIDPTLYTAQIPTLRWRWIAVACLALLALVASAWGLSAAPAIAEDTGASVSFRLDATDSADTYGKVKLIDDGTTTRVIVALHHSPAGEWIAHIHLGTCDQYDGNPVAPLATFSSDTRSRTTVSLPFADLTAGGYLIDIHPLSNKAADLFDPATAIVCGSIPITEQGSAPIGVTTPPKTGVGPQMLPSDHVLSISILAAIACIASIIGLDLRRRAKLTLATRRLYVLTGHLR